MFRPNVNTMSFTSESMLVVLFRIGMVMTRWWDLRISDVCYMLFLEGTNWGWVSLMCAMLWCAAQVCLLAAVLCVSPPTVCPYPMSTAGGLLLWVVCALYPFYLWRSLCPVRFVCACTCLLLWGVVFGCSVTGSQTCFGKCCLALWYFTIGYIYVVCDTRLRIYNQQ